MTTEAHAAEAPSHKGRARARRLSRFGLRFGLLVLVPAAALLVGLYFYAKGGRHVDTVVLLSGDGDFDLLLKKLGRDYSVSTEVYGVPALTARSLVDSADVFHEIGGNLLLQESGSSHAS